MEIDSGEPIPAEEIRYGYRVAVVGLPCDPHWRTEAGIALTGPRRFGYDMDYRPVEEMVCCCVRWWPEAPSSPAVRSSLRTSPSKTARLPRSAPTSWAMQ